MAYLIREGDPTTTGGRVLAGYAPMTVEGCAAARITDPVWCPACQRVGQIAEGHPGFMCGDQGAALEGYQVACGCPEGSNRLIATQAFFQVEDLPPNRIAARAAPVGQAIMPQWAHSIRQHEVANQPLPGALAPHQASQSVAEPGFHIVQTPISRVALETILFGTADPALLAHFRRLNPQLTEYAKPGQLIVLSDPLNQQCGREEAMLMEAAAVVNDALAPMSDEEAAFMVRHQGEIAAMLASTATSIGVVTAMAESHLKAVKSVLLEIEELHKKYFNRNGNLRSKAFFAERQSLFTKLDVHLDHLTRKGIGLPDHPNLKHALGISSRSLVHHWSNAGAAGQIPGYATHISAASKAAKYMAWGGWVGVAVGSGASYLKVQDVCSAGRTTACKKVRFTESGSFIGSTLLSAAASGVLSGHLGARACLAIGASTGGWGGVVCAAVVVGAGAYAGTKTGEVLGETAGEIIYEYQK